MTVDASALGESALGRRFYVPETHGELHGLAIPAAVRLPTFSFAHPPNEAGTLEASQSSQPQTGFPQLQGSVSTRSWVRRDGSRSAVSRETMARFRRGMRIHVSHTRCISLLHLRRVLIRPETPAQTDSTAAGRDTDQIAGAAGHLVLFHVKHFRSQTPIGGMRRGPYKQAQFT